MRRIVIMLSIIALSLCEMRTEASSQDAPERQGEAIKEVCFMPGEVRGQDRATVEILDRKVRDIIGRIGCGSEEASYLIVPTIEVEEVRQTSGKVRNMTVAKGTLTLEAVSADNRDMVWHSITMPLKAIVDSEKDAPEALAKQIKVSDSAFVRFVRVARKKISEAQGEKNKNISE